METKEIPREDSLENAAILGDSYDAPAVGWRGEHHDDLEQRDRPRNDAAAPLGNAAQTASSDNKGPNAWISLPHKQQLLLLALCRIASPLSQNCLLPYLYYLLKWATSSTGSSAEGSTEGSTDSHDPRQISRLSGVLVAAFPLGQFAVSMLWARLSDRYGRRPIVLLGLFLGAVSNLFFGFSKSIGMLLFWRVVAGMGNGNAGVMRTMTAEIAGEKKHQTRAFLVVPLAIKFGMVAALAIGGFFADPVRNLPGFFGKNGLFNFGNDPQGVAWAVAFPFALPALANAAVLGSMLLLVSLGLKETLPSKTHERDWGIRLGSLIMGFAKKLILRKQTARYSRLDGDDLPESTFTKSSEDDASTSLSGSTKSKRSRIWTRSVLITLVSFSLLPLHNAAFIHVFPIYLSTPESSNDDATFFEFNGGLGMAPRSIGLWLSSIGISGIIIQLFIYPRIQSRVGTLGCFRIALVFFPLAYIFTPYLSLFRKEDWWRWPYLAMVLCAQVMARTIAIPSTVLLLTDAAPRKGALSMVHGAGNTAASLAKAIGPAIGGLIFAWGLGVGVVGAVWWMYLTVIAVLALAWSLLMERKAADSASDAIDPDAQV